MKKLQSCLLLTTVALGFALNPLKASQFGDFDQRSVASATEFGDYQHDVPMPFEGKEGKDELTLTDRFYYLTNPQGSATDHVLNKYYVQYNDYPFSLPRDDAKRNTLFFSRSSGQQPTVALLPTIQEKVDQLIFEDFPESMILLGALNTQQEGVGVPKGGKGYALHFFGQEDELRNLSNLAELLGEWSETNLAYCKHLDFAVRVKSKSDFITLLRKILGYPACNKLETLSLRFMSLTNNDCQVLIDELKVHNPELKRLILSFNNIDDTFCEGSGTLDLLLGDIETLVLSHLLKSNKLSIILGKNCE